MKIIIPVVDNGDHKFKIAEGFNSSEFVCLYDTERDACKWMPASEIMTFTDDMSAELHRRNIRCVITRRMKFMALGLFNENGLQVYKSEGDDLGRNLMLFSSNKLPLFTVMDSLEEAGCGTSCSTCSSTACGN